jgi:hypothetical protein
MIKKWTENDLKQLYLLKNEKKSRGYIAEKLNRTKVSISVKWKRLKKKNDTYNIKHRELKYKLNDEFINYLNTKNVKSVLDVFSGNSYYKKYDFFLTTNDIDKKHDTDFHLHSLKLMCKLFLENKKYDLIDLDPFGSAFDCFDIAIKMAKKGIIITFGEFGHKRFKRYDFVGDRYNINNIEDFKIEKFINKVKEIGRNNKKLLTDIKILQETNILRVYFSISKYKKMEKCY